MYVAIAYRDMCVYVVIVPISYGLCLGGKPLNVPFIGLIHPSSV